MSFPAGGVLVTGNIVFDVLARPVEALPPWGATLWVDSIARHMGGNGSNTAYTLAKLGAPVRLAGAVGEDDFGRYVLDRLRGAGVDVSLVRVAAGVQTATTVGLINGRSDRLFLHALGTSEVMDPGWISFDPGWSYFHFASFFQMPKMRRGGVALLERARRAGLFVSVDTMWDARGRWIEDFGALCPLIDLLFVNQQEAQMLAGSSHPGVAGEFFRRRGVGIVVVKMGADGCAVFTAEEWLHAPGYVVTPVDTTGAGDCFCGAFLAALRRGYAPGEAARFANMVGACSVLRVGATEGVLGFEETLAWQKGVL